MDYRESHLEKGPTYDEGLRTSAFDAYLARWESRYVQELVTRHFPSGVPRYLDFACGTGRITSVVAPFARNTVGVDISRSMLDVAEAKVPDATFLEADLTTEGRDLGHFDLVTSFRFFGNAHQSLRSAALSAINKLQVKGAMLLLNNHRNPRSLASLLARFRGADEELDLTHRVLSRQLATHGYSVRQTRPIGVWQYRGKLMRQAGSRPEREESLERMFGASILCHIAPDYLVVAEKVRDVAV